jgi:hypothetical protein
LRRVPLRLRSTTSSLMLRGATVLRRSATSILMLRGTPALQRSNTTAAEVIELKFQALDAKFGSSYKVVEADAKAFQASTLNLLKDSESAQTTTSNQISQQMAQLTTAAQMTQFQLATAAQMTQLETAMTAAAAAQIAVLTAAAAAQTAALTAASAAQSSSLHELHDKLSSKLETASAAKSELASTELCSYEVSM